MLVSKAHLYKYTFNNFIKSWSAVLTYSHCRHLKIAWQLVVGLAGEVTNAALFSLFLLIPIPEFLRVLHAIEFYDLVELWRYLITCQ